MDRRTYESPMDWEYQNSGPFDPTSPFTHAAKGGYQHGFGSSGAPAARANAFATTTPSKQQVPRPPASVFAPELSSKPTGSAFRNPAFHTVREQAIFSDTSGPEDSPALTDNSNWPDDTPDGDHMKDVTMTSPISPSKVDKGTRYGKSNFLSKKHISGKGEIRGHRDYSVADIARKRKRHNMDKDVSSIVRHRSSGWQDSDADDDGMDRPAHSQSRDKNDQPAPRGFVSSLFHMLDEHPDTPEHLGRWMRFLFTTAGSLLFAYIVIGVLWTVQSDITTANDTERLRVLSEITECQNQYTMNECSKKDRPALKMMCDEWYDCMMQNPESIMQFKNFARHLAEVVNEFLSALNTKAALLVLAMFVMFFFSMHWSSNATPSKQNWTGAPQTGANGFNGPMSPNNAPGYVYMVPQTPSRRRQGLVEDDTDTDSSPKLMPVLAPFPSSVHGSPTRRERSRSPVKYRHSPTKGY